MDRISTSTKALDLFGVGKHGFKDGNLGAGILPTDLNAAFFNDWQEEMLTIIEANGLTPTAGVRTQIYQAIQLMIATATGDYKASVRFTTTGNVSLAGLGTQAGGDWGGALTANDRILVKDNTVGSQNGLYLANAGAWTRTSDADGAGELSSGTILSVEEGALLADSTWMLVTDGTITIGTTALVFTRKDSGGVQSAARVRQTVETGSVDANGQANFMSIGTGLAVNLAATAVPVTMNLAAGFGASGAIDYVLRETADIASCWSALTPSSTLFLYVDRSTTTGAKSYGFSAVVPIVSPITPSAPVTDQHWFNPQTYVMQRWTGAVWAVVNRLFMGECVTGASTVTSVITYTMGDKWFYPDQAFPANATKTTFSHNFGVQYGVDVKFDAVCITNDNGWVVGEVYENIAPWYTAGAYNWAGCGTSLDSRNVLSYQNGSIGTSIFTKTSGVGTSLTAANWKIRPSAKRRY